MPDKSAIPVSRRRLKELIGHFPRIGLGEFPTPLYEAPRFAKALGGPRLFLKREDLSGLAFGGNKTRQLEYLLGSALQEGADVVVKASAAQSNLCRQTAAACAKLGLELYLVLRKVRGDIDVIRQGNLLLDHILGAKVTLVEAGQTQNQNQMVLDLAEKLRREGRHPYIPYYADAHLATISYVDCLLETLDQLEERGVEADYIYVASGNYTLSGLVLGVKATGAPLQVRGFPSSLGAERMRSSLTKLVNDAAQALGLDLSFAPEEAYISDKYVGEGYGMPTAEGLAALKLLARSEGILLDPVYTSKALAGLIDQAHHGELGAQDTVVFIHTGGTPALFAYADLLAD